MQQLQHDGLCSWHNDDGSVLSAHHQSALLRKVYASHQLDPRQIATVLQHIVLSNHVLHRASSSLYSHIPPIIIMFDSTAILAQLCKVSDYPVQSFSSMYYHHFHTLSLTTTDVICCLSLRTQKKLCTQTSDSCIQAFTFCTRTVLRVNFNAFEGIY